jgi:hypothetical protein
VETTKAYFVKRVNQYGVLLVRERNPKEDFTGWGALEFILNNGEVFVLSGHQFGQGDEEDGLWVDMNMLSEEYFDDIKGKTPPRKSAQIDIHKSAKDYLSNQLELEANSI